MLTGEDIIKGQVLVLDAKTTTNRAYKEYVLAVKLDIEQAKTIKQIAVNGVLLNVMDARAAPIANPIIYNKDNYRELAFPQNNLVPVVYLVLDPSFWGPGVPRPQVIINYLNFPQPTENLPQFIEFREPRGRNSKTSRLPNNFLDATGLRHQQQVSSEIPFAAKGHKSGRYFTGKCENHLELAGSFTSNDGLFQLVQFETQTKLATNVVRWQTVAINGLYAMVSEVYKNCFQVRISKSNYDNYLSSQIKNDHSYNLSIYIADQKQAVHPTGVVFAPTIKCPKEEIQK